MNPKKSHLQTKPVLPSLRPITPNIKSETPRGFNPSSKSMTLNKFSNDFVVSRSMFVHSPRTRAILPNNDNYVINGDLLLINELLKRIPNEINEDSSAKLSPILDRILCITCSWSQEYVSSAQNTQVISDLKQKLYVLIEIDDLLVRSIVCKILISLAENAQSPLLLPISKIFYKLSLDQNNDPFFVLESIEVVLFSLIINSPPEARVFAAGALRNVSNFPEMNQKLSVSEVLDICLDIFRDPNAEFELRVQILGSIRSICKNDDFKKQVEKSDLIALALQYNDAFFEILRTCKLLPALDDKVKLSIMKKISEKLFSDYDEIRLTSEAFLVLSCSLENTYEFVDSSINLIIQSISYPEILLALLRVVNHPQASISKYLDNGIVIDILKKGDYDLEILISAYKLILRGEDDAFAEIKDEYSYLLSLNQ